MIKSRYQIVITVAVSILFSLISFQVKAEQSTTLYLNENATCGWPVRLFSIISSNISASQQNFNENGAIVLKRPNPQQPFVYHPILYGNKVSQYCGDNAECLAHAIKLDQTGGYNSLHYINTPDSRSTFEITCTNSNKNPLNKP